MAVTEKSMESKLKLILNVEKDGKMTAVTKTYGKVKAEASGDGVYAVGNTLAGLQVNTLNKITRVNEVELTSQD